jgi:hypothetical protein
MSLNVRCPQPHLLEITEEPNHIRNTLIAGGVSALVSVYGAAMSGLWIIPVIMIPLFTLPMIFSNRRVNIRIDQNEHVVKRKVGGVLDRDWGKHEQMEHLNQLTSISISRYIKRQGDTFDIALVFTSDRKIQLNNSGLDFQESQLHIKTLEEFFGPSVPVIVSG